ncbi:unnamed protein product [Linum tenue]|uniref:Uncharacterized protein n=1 Tax=Linum tenue TaxID=586396 RepID=A0AAV0N646_9ROSI|nr:unnamed protein product [Linum tenue]
MSSKSSAPTLQVSELCKVAPATDSSESATQFTLPLTYLDTTWFRFPPVELIYLYKPTASSIPIHSFYSLLLSKLKRSLSLTLAQFLTLAGQLQWSPPITHPCRNLQSRRWSLHHGGRINNRFGSIDRARKS